MTESRFERIERTWEALHEYPAAWDLPDDPEDAELSAEDAEAEREACAAFAAEM